MTTTPTLADIDKFADRYAQVRELFDYADGVLFHKAKSHGSRVKGAPTGSIGQQGYVNVRVNGVQKRAHRLIFLWHFGWLPDLIDHIDGDKANNRIENLRACTKSQNGMNRHKVLSATGARNVHPHRGSFVVTIGKEGRGVYVGKFKSIEAADEAAKEARKSLFGDFS